MVKRRVVTRTFKKWEKLVKTLKKRKPKVKNPWALAHWIEKHRGTEKRKGSD